MGLRLDRSFRPLCTSSDQRYLFVGVGRQATLHPRRAKIAVGDCIRNPELLRYKGFSEVLMRPCVAGWAENPTIPVAPDFVHVMARHLCIQI